ncbi:MAG: DpnD/PcfM family protein [Synergistaceae bacterium]|nr:DpnD/PcfM family protein [Synergistaceae bacterium]
MPKFEVIIVEILTKSVTVEADDKTEAFYRVLDDWKNEKYILYGDDFCDVEFEVCPLGEDSDNATIYNSNGFIIKSV